MLSSEVFPELDQSEIDDLLTQTTSLIRAAEVEPIARSGGFLADDSVVRLTPDLSHEAFPLAAIMRTEASAWVDAVAAIHGLDEVWSAALFDPATELIFDWTVRSVCSLMNAAESEGRLIGVDGGRRYRDFSRRWFSEFRSEHGRRFALAREGWVRSWNHLLEAVLELRGRLADVRADLERTLGVSVDDPVRQIQLDGDSHNHGRRVAHITMASGRRVVYKPRSVDGEAGFASLVRMLPEAIVGELSAATVVSRVDHGFMEFVARDAERRAPDSAFAERTGRLGALLYALNSQDMHFENVVASVKGPVPVDLETVLHPARVTSESSHRAADAAEVLLGQSIYGMGLLPLILLAREGRRDGHFDVGFLGERQAAAPGPFRRPSLVNPYSASMRVHLLDDFGDPQAEEPRAVRTQQETRALAAAFKVGFASAYRGVLENRAAFADAVRLSLAGAVLRYVHNPTSLYALVSRSLTSSIATRDRELQKLLAARIALSSRGVDPRLTASEVRQLLAGDIPYFMTKPVETLLHDGDGHVVAELTATPLAEWAAKLDRMGEQDLTAQLAMVDSAFSASVPDNHLAATRTLNVTATASDIVDVVRRIADQLRDSAAPDRTASLPPTWIGPMAAASGTRPWPPGVLSYDLYTGRTGIALALASAGYVLDDASYRAVAYDVLGRTAQLLDSDGLEMRNLRLVGGSAYTGMAGVLWALWHAANLLGDPSLARSAERFVPRLLAELAPDPSDLDMIRGSLGCSLVARFLAPSEPTLAAYEQRIVRAVLDRRNREMWGQSGFAHGISGALYALAGMPRDAVPDAAFIGLLGALDELWDAGQNNWWTNVGHESVAHGWCHGRAGIVTALARVARTRPHVSGADVELHLDALCAEGFGINLTHCHGDLGNLDLLRALDRMGVGGMRSRIAGATADLAPGVLAARLCDSSSRYSTNPSLLVGKSGVLLHLAGRLDTSLSIWPTVLDGAR